MMNLILINYIILLSASTKMISAQESLINFSNTENLLSFYHSQKRLLTKMSLDQSIHLQKAFMTTMKDIYKISVDQKFEEIDKKKCIENQKNELLSSVVIAVEKNDQCWINETSAFENTVNAITQSSDLQMTFPSCFESGQLSVESLECIDQQIKNLQDKNSKVVYQKIYNHLKSTNDALETSKIKCMQFFSQTVNPILPYVKKSFINCIQKEILEQIIDCTDREQNCNLSLANVDLTAQLNHLNLTTLHRVSFTILKIMREKYESMIQTHVEMNTRLENDINSTDVQVKNITCCLIFHKVLLDAAAKFSLDESNKCFNTELSSFENYVTSIVQSEELKLNFDYCYRNNLSESEIFNCLDQTSLRKAQSMKKIYQTAIDNVKNQTDWFSLNIYSCLKTSSDIFSQSWIYANSRFDECKEDQTLICSDPYISNDDYKILSYVRITTNKQLKELLPGMKRPPLIPKLG